MIDWFEIKDYEPKFKPRSIFIGGRGIGKTYSALSYIIDKQPFIYMRNTDVQLKECCTDFGNPFKRWMKDHNRYIYMKPEKNHAVIYEDIDGDPKVIGYGVALSTFENLRGIDLSDVNYVLFDEFCEKKRFSFDQYAAFFNFYETVNRNRELLGEPPLLCILLSNAQRLDNPILRGYGLIPVIETLIRHDQKLWSNKSTFICMPVSAVSALKSMTDSYAIGNSKMKEEALNNKFAHDSFYGVAKRNLREYTGLCMIDDIYIYKHKAQGKYYACSSQCSNVPEFTSKDNFSIFYRSYGRFLDVEAALGHLEYSDYTTKIKLIEILKL